MKLLIDTELKSIAVKNSTTVEELSLFMQEYNMLDFNVVPISILEPTKHWDVNNSVYRTKLKQD